MSEGVTLAVVNVPSVDRFVEAYKGKAGITFKCFDNQKYYLVPETVDKEQIKQGGLTIHNVSGICYPLNSENKYYPNSGRTTKLVITYQKGRTSANLEFF